MDLLRSILVVDSSKRATIAQIAAHPWMNKRYDTAIDNEMPRRKPLQLPIDRKIVEGMHGFGLGSVDEIEKKLEGIIETSEYQEAARVIESTPRTYQIKHVAQQQNKWRLKEQPPKRVIVPSNDDPQSQPAMYDPLISIYYLVKERQLVYREDLIHANEELVPDLGVSEKPTPIITNTDTSGSEGDKKTTKTEASGDDAANNHIKFTTSTKADDGVPPSSPPSTDSKNERRASKRLSNLFQSKRASWDSKRHSTDVLARQSASRVTKGNQDDDQAKKAANTLPVLPTPTVSQSTPVNRNILQKNVSNIGRRLTFKSKSKPKLAEQPVKDSKLSTDQTKASDHTARTADKPSSTKSPTRSSSSVSFRREGGFAGKHLRKAD